MGCMTSPSIFFIVFGVFVLVFIGLFVWLIRRGMKKMVAEREVLMSASGPERDALAAQMGNQGFKGFMKLAGPIFTLLGGGFLIIGVYNIRSASESESWPTAEGVVVSSIVSESRDPGERHSTYGAEVRYEYTVEGVTQEGDRVRFGGNVSSSNPSGARETVERYREGSAIAVFYDPEDPARSVLEPGMSGAVFLFPGIGGLFFVIGVVILFLLLRSNPKDLEVESFD